MDNSQLATNSLQLITTRQFNSPLLTTRLLVNDCRLIRLSPLSIPLSFLIPSPCTCSITIRDHDHVRLLPRNYSTEGPTTRLDEPLGPFKFPDPFGLSALRLSRNIVYSSPDIS